MLYVGIDVASEKHDCCILSENKTVLTSFSFANNAQGFSCLQESLTSLAPLDKIKIGLEATGIYGTNLVEFLRRKGIQVTTLNPLLLKNNLKGTTLRKTKTDKTDAKHIASFLMQEAPQPDLPVSYHISELKSLTRLRFKTVQERSKAEVQAKGVLQVLFPEFKQYFSEVFGASAIAVLTSYSSAKAIAGADADHLASIIRKASRGRLGRQKADALLKAAACSIGTYSKARECALQMYLQRIALFNVQVAALDSEIKARMLQVNSPITSIPGIGFTLGAIILAEIGDIRNFATPAKLLSFMGIEPSVYQSGKFSAASGSMVKRGSPYLRWAIIQAAKSVYQHSNTFSAYAHKKLNENKPFFVAMSHTAKKLVRVIFSILNNNSLFIDSLPASFS